MLTKIEAVKTREENYQRIKELVRISLSLGVNLSEPTRVKEYLKIINLFLLTCTAISLYGHWTLLKSHIDNIPEVAETLCTAFQIIISMVKMIYFLFTQNRFYELLEKVVNHTLLQEIEIFEQEYPINEKLKSEITQVMNGVWKETRLQLLFYLICCVTVMSIYYVSPLLINYYHKVKGTPDYVYLSPFASSFWDDKGMTFPYYHLHMFLDGCGIHICGSSGISFDGVFIILCLHAIGLMKVLCLMVLRSTTDLVPKEDRVNYMRFCIRHYQRTHIFITDIRRMFMHISLSHFLLTLLVFGLVLFKMNLALETDKVTFVRMAVYFTTSSTMCTIYCYNGQQLSSTSENIPLAFYNCLWYDEYKEFKQLVQMMILRTNKELHFDISWFAVMNLATLIALFKMSGSYFVLLRDLSD